MCILIYPGVKQAFRFTPFVMIAVKRNGLRLGNEDAVRDASTQSDLMRAEHFLYFNNSRIKGDDLVPVKCI